MGQIYLVRHGQASFGSADYDQLSELGLQQARLLGAWYARSGQVFHRVVTGAMRRHRQTAEACMAALSAQSGAEGDWQIDADFNEYDHHEVMVRHCPEFDDPDAVKRFLASGPKAKYAFQEMFQAAMARWMSGAHDADYREPWPVFRLRCVAALERLANPARHADVAAPVPTASQAIIVFTSGGTIATLCQHLLGLGDRQTADLNWTLVNCGVTKLLYRPGRMSLSYLNNHAHLELQGEPHAVTYR